MEVKDRIKNRRSELGLTLDEIGRYVGVSKSTVKKWETGYISNMRRDKIVKLAEILQMSPMDLIDDPDAVYPTTQEAMGADTKRIHFSISDTDPQIDAVVSSMKQLNAQGKQRVVDYTEDLVSTGKYKKSPMSVEADTGEIRVAARKSDRPKTSTGPDTDVEI